MKMFTSEKRAACIEHNRDWFEFYNITFIPPFPYDLSQSINYRTLSGGGGGRVAAACEGARGEHTAIGEICNESGGDNWLRGLSSFPVVSRNVHDRTIIGQLRVYRFSNFHQFSVATCAFHSVHRMKKLMEELVVW